MGKSAKYIISTFGVIIMSLIIIPYLISLNNYKSIIESQVYEQTGRDLKIDGDISFAVLPRPKIKLTKIKFASLPQAKYSNLVEVESAKAKLSLLPLLKGNIILSSLELDKPLVNLEKLLSGKGTWDIQATSSNDSQKHELTSTSINDSNSNPLHSLPFIIHDIKIKDGSLRYIEGNKVTLLDNLDLGIKISDIDGPVDFSLNFRALDENLNLKGTIKQLTEKMPISLEMSAFNDKITLNGFFDTHSIAFIGQVKAIGNLKNLSNSIPESLHHQHNLTAEIEANKEKISLKDLKLEVDTIKGEGTVTYNINTSAINTKLDFNPGNISLIVTSGNEYEEGSVGGQIHLTAGNFDAFLKALKVDKGRLPIALNSDLSLNSEVSYNNQSISFDKTIFTFGKILVKGNFGVKNWDSNLSLPYDLNIADADSLLKLLGHKLPLHLGQVHVKGETVIEKDAIDTNTQLTIAKSHITSKGKINTREGAKSNVTISASGASLGQTLHELLSISYNVNLGAFNIEAQVDGDIIDGKHLGIAIGKGGKSNITLGKDATNIISNLNLTLDTKPHFDLEIELSKINFSSMMDANNQHSSSHTISITQKTNSTSHWSHDKIDLSGLGNANGTANIKIHKLIDGSLIFDNINLRSELSDGIFKINSLTGGLYGGKLEGSGSLSNKGNQSANFKASLSGALLRNMITGGHKIKVTDGAVDFSCNLRSEGHSQFEYVNHLEGEMHLNGKNGKISGMDLQKITHVLKKPKDLASLSKDMESFTSKGETAFDKLNADLIISKGIMNITRGELASNEIIANATGSINLPQFSLDSIVTVNTGVKNLPPVRVHLYGSIDNPQHKVDMEAVGQYLINNVLTNTLDNIRQGKTKPKDLLKGILEDRSSKSNNNPDEKPHKEGNDDNDAANQANKLIEKGIKNLFK